MRKEEAMVRLSGKLHSWYENCGDDLFVDDSGKRVPSITFKGEELASMALDFLESDDWGVFQSLSSEEREQVKKRAFPLKIYGY